MITNSTLKIIIYSIFLIFIIIFAFKFADYNKKEITTKFIVRTAILGSISILLYVVPIFNFSLPIFPDFLKIHLDEIPVFVAGFAYGPLSAVFILIIKTIIKIPLSYSLGVGEIVDLLYSLIFILPAVLIYQRKRTFKSSVIGISIGTILQIVVSCIVTTFFVLNFYMNIIGMSEEYLLNACQIINPNITSLKWPFLFIVALPFNAMKDGIVVAFTLLLYKRLHKLLDKIGNKKTRG